MPSLSIYSPFVKIVHTLSYLWMNVKLTDNFQIRQHSWLCLFHIRCFSKNRWCNIYKLILIKVLCTSMFCERKFCQNPFLYVRKLTGNN
jgi:hypothetical protein